MNLWNLIVLVIAIILIRIKAIHLILPSSFFYRILQFIFKLSIFDGVVILIARVFIVVTFPLFITKTDLTTANVLIPVVCSGFLDFTLTDGGFFFLIIFINTANRRPSHLGLPWVKLRIRIDALNIRNGRTFTSEILIYLFNSPF